MIVHVRVCNCTYVLILYLCVFALRVQNPKNKKNLEKYDVIDEINGIRVLLTVDYRYSQ